MAKIRGRNEGTIYQRSSGKWRAQVSLNGNRLSHTANSRRECAAWLKETFERIDEGMTYASSQVPLKEFLYRWIASSKETWRRTTWRHYRYVVRQFITPALGDIKLIDLQPRQIQGLYNGLLDDGVGVQSVRKVHTVLHSALSYAVKTGALGRNPASATIPPVPPTREMDILDEIQVNQLLIAAKSHRLEALIHLAVTTGMRQMELLGLKWGDLDWDRQSIVVQRQLARRSHDGRKFVAPKTRAGRRMIALGSITIEALKEHYDRQLTEKSHAGDSWSEHGLIFPTSVGTPISPRNLLRDFRKLLRRAGLPRIRFHDLRHTSASLMLNHGVPLIVVSRRLGHARPSITLDLYGHLIPAVGAQAAEKIDQLVAPMELGETAPNLHRICTETDAES
jgi:integrase